MKLFWLNFRQDKAALFGLSVFLFVLFLALFAPWIAPYHPSQQFRDALLLPPSWMKEGRWYFVLGTDAVGRDILSRIIYGSRYSLLSGVLVVGMTLFMGALMGLAAGYFRGHVDHFLSRIADILMSVPNLLMALVMVAILGPDFFNAVLSISLTFVPQFFRMTRAIVLSEAVKDYVNASRMAGAGSFRIMVSEILPNCMPSLIVQSTLFFSGALLDVAALGFLGMGAQPPTPEWGSMLADSREFILSAWWVVTFPGLAILIVVLAINLVGDGLRDAFDPKLQRL